MSNPDRLSGIAAFVHAAEAGNFSAAADRMHLSRSSVAKSVARLEQRIGTRLFHRTTRSQSLTEDGMLFYQHCLRVMAELDQAEDALARGRSEVRGRLRITMPGLLGRNCIAPLLFTLAQRHPQLQLDLSFTDRRVDLIEDGIDLAIRSGVLADNSDYQTRPLGMQHMVLCATRDYLGQRGHPANLEELVKFDGIIYGRGQTSALWRFEQDGGRESAIQIPARMCMDDLGSMLDAARAGLGITRLPLWLVHADLKAGNLVQVLAAERACSYPLHLIWPAARQHSHRLRIVIDQLVTHLPLRLNSGF